MPTVTPPDPAADVRKTRRAMYAQIALTGSLPMPREVVLYDSGIASFTFDHVDEGVAWCRHLRYEPRPYVREGRRYVGQYDSITWHGWSVNIAAYEDAAPDEPLPVEQREALAAVADDGTQP